LWSGTNGVLANRKGVMLGDGVGVAVGVIDGVWVEGRLGVKEGKIVGVELLARKVVGVGMEV
jgi:hypothetical protein